MREIKFRAWIVNERRPIIGQRVFEGNQKMVYDFLYWDGEVMNEYDKCFEADKVVLMQHTGLKDKKDNDIYEGDILKVKYYPNGKSPVYKRVEVKYQKIYCEEYGDFVGFDIYRDCEVIGNIYENPKLIGE